MKAGKRETLNTGMMNRVALFGGSFNPPHLGHIEICKHLLRTGECDQIWVIPCFTHPFGKELAPFDDRINMCRFTFQEFHEKVWVSDVEKRLGDVSHTVKTVQHLKYRYPDKSFSLIVGSDVAEEQSDWKNFEKIKQFAVILKVPRGPDSFIPDISSTGIRNMIQSGEKFAELVTMPVAVYIITHGLYHE